MSPEIRRTLNYMNGTGHVHGLRARLRELPPRDAVECERMLDAILERTAEIAMDEARNSKVRP